MRETLSALRGANLSIAAFSQQPTQWESGVLGALCFSKDAIEQQIHADLGVPCMRVPMQRLDGGDSVCEVWHSSGKLTQGQRGVIHYQHDESVLFGVMEMPEMLVENYLDKTPLQQATELAYQQIFSLLDALDYPHVFRVWNYIADINTHSFGLERYHQFNLGRQDAFLAYGREIVGNVPAACALGFRQSGRAHAPLAIAFLAGRAASRSIENPRQISAYQYPQQYGPRRPTFSRASLVRWGKSEVLFVSGTASIVGHATLHPKDVVAQTRETMANIQAVLDEANRLSSQSSFDLANLHYKVYVRHPADLASIRAELECIVGISPNAIYVQADVCRQDLLLEIEATAGYPSTGIAGQLG